MRNDDSGIFSRRIPAPEELDVMIDRLPTCLMGLASPNVELSLLMRAQFESSFEGYTGSAYRWLKNKPFFHTNDTQAREAFYFLDDSNFVLEEP